MANKNKFIHCRLSESDLELFHANAEELDLVPSEYIRYMIRIPVTGDRKLSEYSVIAIDRDTLGKIQSELVRQGHHYNQAVHALNTVAFFVKRGGSNVQYFSEQFDKVDEKLEEVKRRQDAIRQDLSRIESSVTIGGR